MCKHYIGKEMGEGGGGGGLGRRKKGEVGGNLGGGGDQDSLKGGKVMGAHKVVEET